MAKVATSASSEQAVKTGRRANPSIDGPRDKTVCFMLSENEKLDLDRLAYCLNLTRSGLLAKIVAPFVDAASGGEFGDEAERDLLAGLSECRAAVKDRGDMAKRDVTK